MNTSLWIVQASLAFIFLLVGGVKVFRYDLAQKNMSFARTMSRAFVTFVGVVEILGAFGLILPSVTRIVPILTVLAAVGLSGIMMGAIGTHIKLKERWQIISPLTLLALCVFVAYGRRELLPL